ncbi:14742_t:CDS:2, partial [Acaulospora morrowiae]
MTKLCLYCGDKEPDLDPNDDILSEYCSDECRLKALNSGLTLPCELCKAFPKVKYSKYCGLTRCRKENLCIMCRKNVVTRRDSFWCSKS